MGTELRIDHASVLLPLPMSWMEGIPCLGLLHFPARLGWAGGACAGVIAAMVAQQLFARPYWLLLPLSVDLLLFLDLPGRQRQQLAEVPSVYQQGNGPILDFFPKMSIRPMVWI